jgi:hypothetical protein
MRRTATLGNSAIYVNPRRSSDDHFVQRPSLVSDFVRTEIRTKRWETVESGGNRWHLASGRLVQSACPSWTAILALSVCCGHLLSGAWPELRIRRLGVRIPPSALQKSSPERYSPGRLIGETPVRTRRFSEALEGATRQPGSRQTNIPSSPFAMERKVQ